MKLTEYNKGQLMVWEQHIRPVFAESQNAGIGIAILVTVVLAPLVGTALFDGPVWFGGIGTLFFFTMFSSVFYFGWPKPRYALISLDQRTHECTVKLYRYKVRDLSYTFPISDLIAIKVEQLEPYALVPSPQRGYMVAMDKPPPYKELPLSITLKRRKGRPIQGHLLFADVDTRDEVIDATKRLSEVAGIEWGSIVRSTPQDFHLSYVRGRTQAECSNPIDVMDTSDTWEPHKKEKHPQDNKKKSKRKKRKKKRKKKAKLAERPHEVAQLYQEDDVEQDERLDEVIVEPWDPQQHQINGKVFRYEPGHTLIYGDNVTGEWLTMAFVMALLAMVAAVPCWLILGFITDSTTITLTFWKKLMLIAPPTALGTWGLFKVFVAPEVQMPTQARRYEIRFKERTVLRQKDGKQEEFRLDERCHITYSMTHRVVTHTRRDSDGHSSTSTSNHFNGLVMVVGLPEESPLLVAELGEASYVQEHAYHQGLVLAQMISQGFDLPLKIEAKPREFTEES